MPGLLDYFRDSFGDISVEIGKPFNKIIYNRSLEEKWKKLMLIMRLPWVGH